MPSRRHPVIRCIVLFVMLGLLAACSREEETGSAKQAEAAFDWSEYISAYTGPVVSKESRVMVRFVNDIIDNDKLGKNANDVLDITPPVAGRIVYTTRRGITLTPDRPLESGRTYQVRIRTARLKGMPTTPAEFNFGFSVIRQAFDINITGLATDPENDRILSLTGTLVTADTEDNEKIEQILSASRQGKPVAIHWMHNANGKEHVFSINAIERQDQAAKLVLKWNGKPIGVDSSGEREVEVPALGSFKLNRVQAVRDDRQYILVEFSSALNRQQNLNGLLTMTLDDGETVSFTTRIDGNRLRLYPDNTLTGAVTVGIDPGIRNNRGKQLGERFVKQVTFSQEKPQVRFVGKGVILPDNPRLTIPFEAINVDSVQITAFRVFDNNIGPFLQYNTLSGDTNLRLVGRYLWRKSLKLGEVRADKWNRYQIDASELLRAHPGGLFRLTLSINRGNSTYDCPPQDQSVPVKKEPPLKNYEDLYVEESSGWDFADAQYNNSDYHWQDRNNPCKDSYYQHNSAVSDSRNFMASNLGLLARRGQDKRLHVVVTDLRSAEPLGDVAIDVMNFQNQLIEQGKTDSKGFARFDLAATPFYLLARKGKQKGYLKLSQGLALPTGHFDVGGEKVSQGIKGHIYAERGVWRPGDDIYLTFVLQDRNNLIPDRHPVTMQLLNPKGQIMQTLTNSTPVGDFYAFRLKTRPDALTGNWTARAILGGSHFSKKLKIETVVPNRLKVELDFDSEALYRSAMPVKASLFGQWLHGATASKLKAEVSVRLYPLQTRFDRFTDMVFDDPARRFRSEAQTVFDGQLDEQGHARFELALSPGSEAPGMLSAVFTSRVFENSGAFSTSRKRMTFYPYAHFVGIKLPKGDAARGMLLTDTPHKVQIGTLDAHGKPVALKRVRLTLYKIDWKWWWDKSGDDLARYASAAHSSSLKSEVVSTGEDGRGEWEFEIKSPDWGRYLVRACDLDGQHCSGKIFYMDWPGWAGRAREQSGAGASALNFSADKPRYTVGETAHLQMPGSTEGRALISIETGSRIIAQHWMEFGKDKSRFDLPLTADMSPNVYVSVTLIQPHAGRDNDRPIRLYGVIPIMVDDPATRLAPVIDSASEWAPESRVGFSVTENNGRAMTYTVAIVDEGLLGLTGFQTPDLHKRFYKKEALGVSSWDLFDEVTGAYSAELTRLLALGGGDSADEDNGEKDKRRFPPVVKFLGPFQLAAGQTRQHAITLPQYLGAVRLMLVAGQDGAYGKADKSVFVRQALTMLPTVPRVLGPDEELTVPVALFVSEDDIKQVELRLEADDHFDILGPARQTLDIAGPGEQMGFLRLRVRPRTGKAHLAFIASSGKHQSRTDIDIEIRSANPPTRRQWSRELRPGESWQQAIRPHGIKNTNTVSLEVSSLPPINLQRRLNYLIRYPHGCVEQVTSAVFPQLYLSSLISLDAARKQQLDNHVHAGLDRLRGFQSPDGGFMYWPGQGRLNPWATTYVGHFLLEAEKKGYQVPATMLDNWLSYQQRAARNWLAGSGRSVLDQAYRLYTLALAGYAELGAMNRLREMPGLDNTARWQLAAAYALAGVQNAATELVANTPPQASRDPHSNLTFGSELRDQALILNSLALLGMNEEADALAKKIARQLSADKWYSTQSIAWSLLAMARHTGEGKANGHFQYQYRLGQSDPRRVKAGAPIDAQTLADFPLQGQTVVVKNTDSRTLYASLMVEGVPPAGTEQAAAHDLALQIRYTDLDGNRIDVSRLTQSTDLIMTVQITNQTGEKIDNLALSQILPSGWEIHNTRLDSQDDAPAIRPDFDYQDIRDDRVYTYFGLEPEAQKSFSLKLNASYLGHYYLPAVTVEAMYDARKYARSKGQWVEVIRTAP